jgi:hypothetical protein
MPSQTTLLWSAAVLTVASSVAVAVAAPAITLPSYSAGNKTYYAVKANDPTGNTGNKVCQKLGRSCVGYTLNNTNACKFFHPTAKTLRSVNGSKAGFYCDGAPQKGLACEKMKNTCEVCPNCNVNLACDTDLTTMNQFREAYVECGGLLVSSSAKSSATTKSTAYGAPQNPQSSNNGIGSYPNKKVCEFYQPTGPTAKVVSNKKLVTCSAPFAADNFCKTTMGSRLAKSEKCEDNGVIVCSIPCSATLSRCSADVNRPRGVNALTIDSCATASTSTTTTTKKKAGELCKHGGECITGWCLGTGRPNNQDIYQCSCRQDRLDTSCNK